MQYLQFEQSTPLNQNQTISYTKEMRLPELPQNPRGKLFRDSGKTISLIPETTPQYQNQNLLQNFQKQKLVRPFNIKNNRWVTSPASGENIQQQQQQLQQQQQINSEVNDKSTTDNTMNQNSNQNQNMEMMCRMRDLETKLVDMQSHFNSRMNVIIQEHPQKYLRELKSYEDKDSMLWTESQNRINQQQQLIDKLSADLQHNAESTQKQLLSLSKKLEDYIFNSVSTQRAVEGLLKVHNADQQSFQQIVPYNSNIKTTVQNQGNLNNNNNNQNLEREVQQLRELQRNDSSQKGNLFQEILKQYEGLFAEVQRNEAHYKEALNEHRSHITQDQTNIQLQLQQLQSVKEQQRQKENDHVQYLLSQVDRKIEAEVQRRLEGDFSTTASLNQKLTTFQQEAKTNERVLLQGEAKVVQYVQDSVQAITQLIKGTKEQLEAQIATSNTLFQQNASTFESTLSDLSAQIKTKMEQYDMAQVDQEQKVQQVQEQMHLHRIDITDALDREFGRIQQVTQSFEDTLAEQLSQQKVMLDQQQKDMMQWRDEYQNKSYVIFQEVSSSLKTLKQQIQTDKANNEQKFKELEEKGQIEKENMELRIQNVIQQQEHSEQQIGIRMKEMQRINNQKMGDLQTQLLLKISDESIAVTQKCNDLARNYTNAQVLETKNLNQEQLRKTIAEWQGQFEKMSIKMQLDLETQMKLIHQWQKDERSQNKVKFDEVDKCIVKMQEVQTQSAQQAAEKLQDAIIKLQNEAKQQESRLKLHVKDVQFICKKETILEIKTLYIDKLQQEIDVLKDKVAFDQEQLLNKARVLIEKAMLEQDKKFQLLIDTEAKERNSMKEEILDTINQVKRVMQEQLKQKVESIKALIKALISQEQAERERAIQEVYVNMNQRLTALEALLRQLVLSAVDELRRECDTKFNNLEQQLLELKSWVNEQINKVNELINSHYKEYQTYIYLQEAYKVLRDSEYDETVQNIEYAIYEASQKENELKEALEKEVDERSRHQRIIYQHLQRNDEHLSMHDTEILEQQQQINDKQRQLNLQKEALADQQQQIVQINEGQAQFKQQVADKFSNVDTCIVDVDNKYKARCEVLSNEIDALQKEIQENIQQLSDEVFEAVDEIQIDCENREYLHQMYEKLIDEEQRGQQEIQKETLAKHQSQLDEQKAQIETHSMQIDSTEAALKTTNTIMDKQFNETNAKIDSNDKQINEKVDKNAKQINEKVDANNDEFLLRAYIDDILRQLSNKEQAEATTFMHSKFDKVANQLKSLVEEVQHGDSMLHEFEEKTETNFNIAEKAIKAHTSFLNVLDVRVTMEEMLNSVIFKQLEDKMAHNAVQQMDNQHQLKNELQNSLEDKYEQLVKADRALRNDIDIVNQREEAVETEVHLQSIALALTENELRDSVSQGLQLVQSAFSDLKALTTSQNALYNDQFLSAQKNIQLLKSTLINQMKQVNGNFTNLDTQINSQFEQSELDKKQIQSDFQNKIRDLLKDTDALVKGVVDDIYSKHDAMQDEIDHQKEVAAKVASLEEHLQSIDLEQIQINKQEIETINGHIQNTNIDVKGLEQTVELNKQYVENNLQNSTGLTEKMQQTQNEIAGIQNNIQKISDDVSKHEGGIIIIQEKLQKIQVESEQKPQQNDKSEQLNNKIEEIERQLKEFEERFKSGEAQEQIKEQIKSINEQLDEIQKERQLQNNQLSQQLLNMNQNLHLLQTNISDNLNKNYNISNEKQDKINNKLDQLFDKLENVGGTKSTEQS